MNKIKSLGAIALSAVALGGCTLTLPGTSSSVTVSGGSSPTVNAIDWTAILDFGQAAALEVCAIKPTLSTISEIILTKNGKNIGTSASEAKAEADAAADVFCNAVRANGSTPATVAPGDPAAPVKMGGARKFGTPAGKINYGTVEINGKTIQLLAEPK